MLLRPRLRRLIFLLALAGAALCRLAAETQSDEAILAEMKVRVAELQRRMLATEDLGERLKLQNEARKILDDAIARVSPQARPMLEVTLKVMGGLHDASRDYIQSASQFFEGPDSPFHQLKTQSAVRLRLAQLESLAHANADILSRINRLEQDVSATLERSGLPAKERRDFITGFRNGAGRKMGPLRAIRTLDGKLYDEWRKLYTLLEKEWGHWSVDEEDVLTWEHPEAEKEHREIIAEITRIAELQRKAEQTLAERT